MRPKQLDIDLADVDVNSIFEDQTAGGAGNLTLNGADVSGGVWTTPDGFAHQISLESAGNLSGVTFTVTGYQDAAQHIALTEAITGPNATTVESSNYFYSISNIAVDGAVGTNVEGGFVDEAISQTIPNDVRAEYTSVGVYVTGTINYTIEQTFDDVQNLSDLTYNWQNVNDSNLVGATANQSGALYESPRGLRVKVNSYNTNAELQVTFSTTPC